MGGGVKGTYLVDRRNYISYIHINFYTQLEMLLMLLHSKN